MTDQTPIFAVIPAAGVGKRMASNIPKQYLKINDKTILAHTVEALAEVGFIKKIIIAISPQDQYFDDCGLQPLIEQGLVKVVDGGKERADSVLAGLNGVEASEEAWVLVHDAARPNVKLDEIHHLVESCLTKQQGGILAFPVRDTMKRAKADSFDVEQTECRENLWHALTPQFFPLKSLSLALDTGLALGRNITDEASAMEQAGYSVLLIEGSSDNIKITRPEDLALAQFYLNQR